MYLNALNKQVLQERIALCYVALPLHVSGLVFRKAERLSRLQHDLLVHDAGKKIHHGHIPLVIFASLVAAIVIIATSILREMAGILAETVLLALIDIYVYRMLKNSMGSVPPEWIIIPTRVKWIRGRMSRECSAWRYSSGK
ncbi:MAG: hypothetical protein M1593_01785 [Candidatus Thermoplasmatota archaeon]|nr:hypothetical protein [Candidatus Thermoplasmatota archaeon]